MSTVVILAQAVLGLALVVGFLYALATVVAVLVVMRDFPDDDKDWP